MPINTWTFVRLYRDRSSLSEALEASIGRINTSKMIWNASMAAGERKRPRRTSVPSTQLEKSIQEAYNHQNWEAVIDMWKNSSADQVNAVVETMVVRSLVETRETELAYTLALECSAKLESYKRVDRGYIASSAFRAFRLKRAWEDADKLLTKMEDLGVFINANLASLYMSCLAASQNAELIDTRFKSLVERGPWLWKDDRFMSAVVHAHSDVQPLPEKFIHRFFDQFLLNGAAIGEHTLAEFAACFQKGRLTLEQMEVLHQRSTCAYTNLAVTRIISGLSERSMYPDALQWFEVLAQRSTPWSMPPPYFHILSILENLSLARDFLYVYETAYQTQSKGITKALLRAARRDSPICESVINYILYHLQGAPAHPPIPHSITPVSAIIPSAAGERETAPAVVLPLFLFPTSFFPRLMVRALEHQAWPHLQLILDEIARRESSVTAGWNTSHRPVYTFSKISRTLVHANRDPVDPVLTQLIAQLEPLHLPRNDLTEAQNKEGLDIVRACLSILIKRPSKLTNHVFTPN